MIEPDNGSTFSINRECENETTGEKYYRAERWPKDLFAAVTRLREQFRKEDPGTYSNTEDFIDRLKEIDEEFLEKFKEAIANAEKERETEKPNPKTEEKTAKTEESEDE